MLRYVLLPLLALITLAVACGGSERSGWVLVREPEDTTLYLAVTVAGCHPFDHINVTETNDSVTISAYVREGEVNSCDDWGAAPDFQVVDLKAPLGDRALRGCNADLQWFSEANDDCRAVRTLDKDQHGDALPSLSATATPGRQDYASRRAQWRLDEEPDGTRLNIVIAVGSSSCREFDQVIVTETDDSVLIEALLHNTEVEPTVIGDIHYGTCTSDLAIHRELVILRSRLAEPRTARVQPAPDG